MSAPVLIINGVELTQLARLDFQQTFERLDAGSSLRRRANGAAMTMSRWERWSTSLSGSGWIPPALLSIQRGIPFTIHSVAPVALRPGEALPTNWTARTDWPETLFTDKRGVVSRLIYPILTVVSAQGARYVTGSVSPQWEMACEEV